MVAELASQTATVGASRERPLVLVVDDDEALQLLARESLEQEGFAVEEAADCAQALAVFQRFPPDLVLLDVNLPDGDGFSVCNSLRQLRGGVTIPVLMMTAADDIGAIHHAYETGATDFITKPVNWVLLRYRLRYILRAGRAFERLAVSEARLTRAQQIASLGHWELDLETGMMHWSEEAARTFGLEPGRAQTPADVLWQAVHRDDRDHARAVLEAVVTSRRPENLQFRIVTPGGEERTVHQRTELVLDEIGRPRHVVATAQDVTERVRLEAQLRQAQKMEAVGQLAGGIAHDFNNLLTVINGRCELLLGRLSEQDPVRRDLQQILHTGERAAGLTSQLLMFSRKQVLQRKVLDLNDVMRGLSPLLQRVLDENITKVLDLCPSLGRVSADRGQIEQVLLNLVVNARDAMPQGGRLTIRTANTECDESFVRCHPGSRPGSYVTLAVCDTGVGMDERVLARIFEPFFTTKGIGKGTGLGLATVYGIVKHHGGYIAVESKPGAGSTFTLYLQRVDAAVDASRCGETAPLAPARGETILLAEDDAGVRELCREILREVGYAVVVASHGPEALRIAQCHTGPIHLLVTDVVMPEMSGVDLAQQLASLRPGIPTLFVSGYPGDILGQLGFLPDQDNFLPKPFAAETLLGKVRNMLDTSAPIPEVTADGSGGSREGGQPDKDRRP